MSSFEQFIAELDAEAEADGPAALAGAAAASLEAAVSMRLGLRRVELGLTQEQVAEMTGIDVSELKDIEAGAIDLSVGLLGALCRVLELDVQLVSATAN